jgi:succinate-semialdehyde dehydrogenase/glutarate-semialdehyde dehydrogenase
VHADVAERFSQLFADAMGALVLGDPTEESTDVGPLATEQGLRDVQELVDDAVGKGATVLVGGEVPDGRLVLPADAAQRASRRTCGCTRGGLRSGRAAARRADLDAALELANDTEFGLGSNAWTNDPAEQERFAATSRRAWSSSTG